MSNKGHSVAVNYSYNFIYQIVAILTPLIVTPHISRVLDPDGVGAFSYTQSLCSYFSFFAIIGTDIYGQREIALCRNDREKRSKIFWEIYIIRFVGIVITTVIYIFFSSNYEDINRTLLYIQLIGLFGGIFNIVYIIQGVEDFRLLFFRNLIARIVSVACIFIFVNKESDLIAYAVISTAVVVVANITLWFNLGKYIDPPNIKELNCLKHIKPSLALFLPTIALRLYDTFDKTMMGTMLEKTTENGYYEEALKIITISITAVTSLGTVVLPRIASLYASGDKEKINSYIYKSFDIVWFLSIPMAVGLFCIADNLVPWFFGSKFLKVADLLKWFSIICIPMGLKNVIGIQYLIPTMRQRQYTISIITGLFINIGLNSFMIPIAGSIGAIIASIISEIAIVVIQFFSVKKDFCISKCLLPAIKKICAVSVMFGVLIILSKKMEASIFHTFLLVSIGIIIYCVCLIIIRDRMMRDIICRIIKVILKKGK